MIDRTAPRKRPPGSPVMYQTWGKLLFLHWPVPLSRIRPLVPSCLEIDTFDGTPWVGVTPFTMWNIRPPFFPPLPAVSSSHEINVRTYVSLNGFPGLWFLSLDASNALAVLGARLLFGLPYYDAKMTLEERGETTRFTSRRRHSGAPAAEFAGTWTAGGMLGETRLGSLDFFLIERYCLYTLKEKTLYRVRIHHRPWPLRRATLASLHSTMIESHGLPTPQGKPLLHLQSAPLQVGIWPLEKM